MVLGKAALRVLDSKYALQDQGTLNSSQVNHRQAFRNRLIRKALARPWRMVAGDYVVVLTSKGRNDRGNQHNPDLNSRSLCFLICKMG